MLRQFPALVRRRLRTCSIPAKSSSSQRFHPPNHNLLTCPSCARSHTKSGDILGHSTLSPACTYPTLPNRTTALTNHVFPKPLQAPLLAPDPRSGRVRPSRFRSGRPILHGRKRRQDTHVPLEQRRRDGPSASFRASHPRSRLLLSWIQNSQDGGETEREGGQGFEYVPFPDAGDLGLPRTEAWSGGRSERR